MITIFFTTLVMYLLLLAVIRLMGKRQIGQLAPSEFVVTMLIANLASIPMEDPGVPLHNGILPLATVLGAEVLLSLLSLKSIRVRKILAGKPVILIDEGRLLQKNLHTTRVSMDELMGHLRLSGVLDIRQVQYAILETNGSLSVFLYPADAPATASDAGIKPSAQHLAITVVQDGKLFTDDLHRAGKSQVWLERQLKNRNATLRQTLLLTIDAEDNVTFIRKEEG